MVASTGQREAALETDGRKVADLGVADGLAVVGWPGLEYRVRVDGDTSAATLSVTQTDGSSVSVSIPLLRLAAASTTAAKTAAKR